MPAFNYEFCRGFLYDVRTTPSQVGVLSEYFRTTVSKWRTSVPVFSICGVGPKPDHPGGFQEDSRVIEPFGPKGDFAELVRRGGSVLMVGCDFRFLTLVHYAEVHNGAAPPYRYDKTFEGSMHLEDGEVREAIVRYHVTPLHSRVTYNWDYIRSHMVDVGVAEALPGWNQAWLLNANGFVQAWQEQSHTDPLWALSSHARSWVEPLLERLGRRFQLLDFESVKR